MNAVAPIRPIYRPVIALQSLALDAIATAQAFNGHTRDDAEWDRLNAQAFEAKAALLGALEVFGIDKAVLDALSAEGVL